MTRQRSTWVRLAMLVAALAVLATSMAFVVPVAARSWLAERLGPHGSVEAVDLLTAQVAVRGVEIGKPNEHWPLPAQLRVRRAVADVELSALKSAPRTIPKATIEGLYLAIVRRRDGSLQVLPDFTSAKERKASTEKPTPFSIEDLVFEDATIEMIDDSMPRRARLRLTQVHGHLRHLDFPELRDKTLVDLAGKLPGPNSTGTVQLSGFMVLRTQDSQLELQGRGADLRVFEPYLLKSTSNGVESGSFDMRLSSTMRKHNVDAPGHIDIHELKLKPGEGAGDSFLNMPRAAVIRSLQGTDETISTDFTLKGNLDDPKFSAEDGLTAQLGVGIAAALGVSIIGLAEGVGNLGVQGTKAVGSALGGGDGEQKTKD